MIKSSLHPDSLPRVRFAPAPTGTMHLGNIRTALMNFLFAKQRHGTFVLRIEDTDAERNYDLHGEALIKHLLWLGLDYDEGPLKGGPYTPYFQSQRSDIYQKVLQTFTHQGYAYRCFCTQEELEKKRERQIALKMAPRYDRTCLTLSQEQIDRLVQEQKAYIWRMKLDHDKKVIINDLARGHITFELKNFSDFALTRADHSFTFIFANFVDDMVMQITHVFRGEDHLSNTANQAALYGALGKELPIYYHLPILCNIDGQKLSKRDFGFSITDLQSGGFLPEALCNYLLTMTGSFKQEIMPFNELAAHANFDNLHAGGTVKYDEQKLRWFNHQHIQRADPQDLFRRCFPFIVRTFDGASEHSQDHLTALLQIVKSELYTLTDVAHALKFFFVCPTISHLDAQACVAPEHLTTIISIVQKALATDQSDAFVACIKEESRANSIPLKQLFLFVRLALTGSVNGLGIAELYQALGCEEVRCRLERALAAIESNS